jgi:extracellular elastinolytic metalloproteinase
VHAAFEGEVASHAFIKQRVNNITVANAVANVAFDKNNRVIAFGTSFVSTGGFLFLSSGCTPNTVFLMLIVPNPLARTSPALPTVPVNDAIATAEEYLDGTYDSTKYPAPSLQYLAQEDGTLALIHSFHVTNDTAGTYYEAFVDAHSGTLLSATDFVAQASVCFIPSFCWLS